MPEILKVILASFEFKLEVNCSISFLLRLLKSRAKLAIVRLIEQWRISLM